MTRIHIAASLKSLLPFALQAAQPQAKPERPAKAEAGPAKAGKGAKKGLKLKPKGAATGGAKLKAGGRQQAAGSKVKAGGKIQKFKGKSKPKQQGPKAASSSPSQPEGATKSGKLPKAAFKAAQGAAGKASIPTGTATAAVPASVEKEGGSVGTKQEGGKKQSSIPSGGRKKEGGKKQSSSPSDGGNKRLLNDSVQGQGQEQPIKKHKQIVA